MSRAQLGVENAHRNRAAAVKTSGKAPRPLALSPTVRDLIDQDGLFKPPGALPRRVRQALLRYRVSPDRRNATYKFRDPWVSPQSGKRKARRVTQLTKAQLETMRRLLDEEIAQLRAANQGGT